MTFDQELWNRIENIVFDDPGAKFSFSKRLARDNRWSADYTKRAIDEYRRFVYLALRSGHEVTPSDQVDQVWHLHLTYTRHYWGQFTDAIGTPLHHGPTFGGSQEKQRYNDNYQNTINSYYDAFGETPPEDIWPPAIIRFGQAPFMQRINTHQNIVVAKEKLASVTRGSSLVALGALLVSGTLSAVAATTAPGVEGLLGTAREQPLLIAGIILILLIPLIAYIGMRTSNGDTNTDKSGSGFVPFGGNDGNNGGEGSSGCGSGCGGCGG